MLGARCSCGTERLTIVPLQLHLGPIFTTTTALSLWALQLHLGPTTTLVQLGHYNYDLGTTTTLVPLGQVWSPLCYSVNVLSHWVGGLDGLIF